MRIKFYSFAFLFSFFAFALPQIQIGQEAKPKTGPKSGESKSAKGAPPEKEAPTKELPADDDSKPSDDKDSFKIEPGSRSQADAIWKKKTPGMAFKVMRQHGTETKFSGKYTRSKTKGIYRC